MAAKMTSPSPFFTILPKSGIQIKLKSRGGARKGHAADTEHDQDNQQKRHHDFGDALNAVLESHTADTEGQKYSHHHPEGHGARRGQHIIEYAAHLIRGESLEGTGSYLKDIGNHPAAHGGIEHHQQVIAQHGQIALDVPFGAFGLQHMKAAGRGLPAGRGPPQIP